MFFLGPLLFSWAFVIDWDLFNGDLCPFILYRKDREVSMASTRKSRNVNKRFTKMNDEWLDKDATIVNKSRTRVSICGLGKPHSFFSRKIHILLVKWDTGVSSIFISSFTHGWMDSMPATFIILLLPCKWLDDANWTTASIFCKKIRDCLSYLWTLLLTIYLLDEFIGMRWDLQNWSPLHLEYTRFAGC